MQFASFEEASENVGWKKADLLVQNSMHHFEYFASPTFYTYRYTSLFCVCKETLWISARVSYCLQCHPFQMT